jgi:hypothetical protein
MQVRITEDEVSTLKEHLIKEEVPAMSDIV